LWLVRERTEVIAAKGILVDAREWIPGRMTGIGRMLAGCVDALAASPLQPALTLAVTNEEAIPERLKNRQGVARIKLPGTFLKSERALSGLTGEGFAAFISPYPKLPLFGARCPSVHTIHDVLDLTDTLYRHRIKTLFDKYRLRKALCRADLSWYDSRWSMEETERLIGTVGKNPKVRHLGVDDRFDAACQDRDSEVLGKYGLQAKGYILVVGNGLPHKNLGLLLNIAEHIPRKLLFVGVSKQNQGYWQQRYTTNRNIWLTQAAEEEMPALLRNAFCLAQPSFAEGYGYPPLEAMACGTPAVVSSIAVLVETTGGQALIAEPQNGQSWIEAFYRLENADLYRQQVAKGHQWVAHLKGRSGWQGHVADITELIGSRS